MENSKKLVIVSGVSNGLGYHLAKLLKEDNYNVVGIYRTQNSNIEDLAKQGCFLVKWNLKDLEGFENFKIEIKRILEEYFIEGMVFINNAATINPIGHIKEFSNDEITEAVSVNITTNILITKLIISLNEPLEIINISSGAADRAIVGWGIYCMSKAANKMFFNVLQEQYPHIKVQQIDPGIIDTNMQKEIRSIDKNSFPLVDKFVKYFNEGTLQHPKDVARKVINKIGI